MTYAQQQDYQYIMNELLYAGFQPSERNKYDLQRLIKYHYCSALAVFALQIIPESENTSDFIARLNMKLCNAHKVPDFTF